MMNLVARTMGVIATMVVVVWACVQFIYQPFTEQQQAFGAITAFHSSIRAPSLVQERLVVYLSWFDTDDPRRAEEYLLFSTGQSVVRQVIWNFGTTTMDGPTIDKPVVDVLEDISELPEGLAGSSGVPVRRLLIVSLDGAGWGTEYYDREHAPGRIKTILRLSKARGLNGKPIAAL